LENRDTAESTKTVTNQILNTKQDKTYVNSIELNRISVSDNTKRCICEHTLFTKYLNKEAAQIKITGLMGQDTFICHLTTPEDDDDDYAFERIKKSSLHTYSSRREHKL
jgi:hypothetical protein